MVQMRNHVPKLLLLLLSPLGIVNCLGPPHIGRDHVNVLVDDVVRLLVSHFHFAPELIALDFERLKMLLIWVHILLLTIDHVVFFHILITVEPRKHFSVLQTRLVEP